MKTKAHNPFTSRGVDLIAWILTACFLVTVAACAQRPAPKPTLDQCREVAKDELIKAAKLKALELAAR